MTLNRRDFITTAASSAAATTIAAPAVAQPSGQVKWRIQTSWPKSLDAMHGAVDVMAKRVAELTEGRFEIRVFAGGEVVPALQVYDAVSAGTIEGGHTLTSFYIGKRPALAFDAGVAFGM